MGLDILYGISSTYDKMKKNIPTIIPLFPEAVLYLQNIKVDSNKVINYLKNLEFHATKSTIEKKAESYQSKNLNVLKNLNFLKKEINKHVNYYLQNVFLYKMNYKFTTSWATKTSFKGFGQKHHHSNTFLSGVYYPKGNKNFKIKFYKRNFNNWIIKPTKYNEFNANELTFHIITDNTLILFPNHLQHSIENNEDNAERYSVAFNINPKGLIGEKDNAIVF